MGFVSVNNIDVVVCECVGVWLHAWLGNVSLVLSKVESGVGLGNRSLQNVNLFRASIWVADATNFEVLSVLVLLLLLSVFSTFLGLSLLFSFGFSITSHLRKRELSSISKSVDSTHSVGSLFPDPWVDVLVVNGI